jgi:hypothetical protein
MRNSQILSPRKTKQESAEYAILQPRAIREKGKLGATYFAKEYRAMLFATDFEKNWQKPKHSRRQSKSSCEIDNR